MMKLLIYLTLWAVSHAAYVNRIATINHMKALNNQNRRPTAFRPGVMWHRPWMQQRLVQSGSHRTPYYIYKNNPQNRYAMKHYTQRPVFSTPWKSARVPAAGTSEYEFVRAASATPQLHTQSDGGSGAIHTIPAPNLSLSDKPIVVVDADNVIGSSSEAPKQTYEVTEKYPDPSHNQITAKIEQPIGFSKATSLTGPELQHLVRGPSWQLTPDLGLSLALPHVVNSQPMPQPFNRPQQSIVPHQTILQQQPIVPQSTILHEQPLVPQPSVVQAQFLPQRNIVSQQFAFQNINNVPDTQDILHASPGGLVISPNALYQPDPAFLQKLQNQLLQRFPGIEFIPYATHLEPVQIQTQAQTPQPEVQSQLPKLQIELQNQASQTQPPIYLLQNEQITKQTPSSFVTSTFVPNENRIIQRASQEGTYVTLVPQALVNATDYKVETTTSVAQNINYELVAAESQPSSNIVSIVDESTEEQKTTPVYIAQVSEADTGNVVTDGFYSVINDVRAAAALAQVEKLQDQTQTNNNTPNNNTVQNNETTTTINPDLKPYFVQKQETNKDNVNQTMNELKPVLGVPFSKQPDTVNVSLHTMMSTNTKSNESDVKLSKDGSVYAGQIVEATITEDHDFNKQKAALMQRRAPLRLVAVEKKETTTSTPSKTVIRARIPPPPRSKLTFDPKTGEPVLRIYASYVDTPLQNSITSAKQGSKQQVKEPVGRKQNTVDNWKSSNVQALDKSKGFDANQVTQFGLKLRSRSDDYVPLFEDYEE